MPLIGLNQAPSLAGGLDFLRESILLNDALSGMEADYSFPVYVYLTSFSRFSNRSEAKKSWMLISRPSQSFLRVVRVMLWFRPLMKLLTVNCVIQLMVRSLFRDVFHSRQSSRILTFAASPMVTGFTPFLIRGYPFPIEKINPFDFKIQHNKGYSARKAAEIKGFPVESLFSYRSFSQKNRPSPRRAILTDGMRDSLFNDLL